MKTDLDPIKAERRRRLCPDHGYDRVAGCEPCKAFLRWKYAQKKAGNASLTPITKQMRGKVEELLATGLTFLEIGKLIGANENLAIRLFKSGHRRGRPRKDSPYRAKSIHVLHARNLMSCEVSDFPLVRRAQVDPTGLRRRLDVLALRKFSAVWVAHQIGLNDSVTTRWNRCRWLPGWQHVKVKELFESIPRDAIGPGVNAGVLRVVRRGALPDRFWTDEQFDDPGYDPLKPLGDPVGVRRRLRALYREGRGPVFLGGMLAEEPATVESWTLDGPVPGYARHLVAAVFDRWGGSNRPGDRVPHDQAAAGLAVREGWPSSYAWEDVDIDSPVRAAKETGPKGLRGDTVDEELVRKAIAGGVRRTELTKAETTLVVQVLAGRGLSARQIGVHLRWWKGDDRPEKARFRAAKDAASAFASRERIPLRGSSSDAYHESRGLLSTAA